MDPETRGLQKVCHGFFLCCMGLHVCKRKDSNVLYDIFRNFSYFEENKFEIYSVIYYSEQFERSIIGFVKNFLSRLIQHLFNILNSFLECINLIMIISLLANT